MRIDEAAGAVRTRPMLLRRGMAQASIEAAVRDGSLKRIGRGSYVDASVWDAANHEAQHLMSVVSAHRRADRDIVFSHVTACLLHGLPLVRHVPGGVHTSGAQLNGRVMRSEPEVARHQVAVPDSDVVVVAGIRCTTLARSVADTIRYVPEETAISIADAAMRRVAWDDAGRRYDSDAAERFRVDVRSKLPVGGRGVKQARYAIGLADGRAQGPGESISRLYLVQLGYRTPRLQVPVRGPKGADLHLDMVLDDVARVAEFDGKVKYVDPEMRAGRPMEDVLLAEKAREDWIRGVTGLPVVRWAWDDIASIDTLRRRLRAFGMYPPPPAIANPHSVTRARTETRTNGLLQ